MVSVVIAQEKKIDTVVSNGKGRGYYHKSCAEKLHMFINHPRFNIYPLTASTSTLVIFLLILSSSL